MKQLSHDAAQTVAIAGLQYLAQDDDLLMRFCNLTGLLANDMREAAGRPGFFPALLDFYLSHEPDLIAFAEAQGINPEDVAAARYALAPEDTSGFE